MSSKYSVTFDVYTERHYIKAFKKKYSKRVWQFTENAIRSLCANFEELVQTEQCETIVHSGSKRLCKLEFAVAGTQKSPKKSGNRSILLADVDRKQIKIVLVYHKSNIVKSGNETVAWQKIVKREFPEVNDLLS